MPSYYPKKLFRFQAVNVNTIISLCSNELYFADPSFFNDPLDCQPHLEQDSNLEELRLLLSALIKRRVHLEAINSLNNAYIEPDDAFKTAENISNHAAGYELYDIQQNAFNPYIEYNNIEQEETEIYLLSKSIHSELLKQYDKGVCCFSSTFKNPLLWSHYADHHRGLCIGYSLDRKPQPEIHKIDYKGNRKISMSLIVKAILENDFESLNLLKRSILLTKASSWRYESEWRMINSRGAQESELALRELTFGLRCPNPIKHTVISALESRKEIKFYEMEEIIGKFKLTRKLIDIEKIKKSFPKCENPFE